MAVSFPWGNGGLTMRQALKAGLFIDILQGAAPHTAPVQSLHQLRLSQMTRLALDDDCATAVDERRLTGGGTRRGSIPLFNEPRFLLTWKFISL